MKDTAHLVGEGLKGKVLGTLAVSCCSFFVLSGLSGVMPYQSSIRLITWCESVLYVLCYNCCSIWECGCYVKQSDSEDWKCDSCAHQLIYVKRQCCKNETQCPASVYVFALDGDYLCILSVNQSFITCASGWGSVSSWFESLCNIPPSTGSTTQKVNLWSRWGQRSHLSLSDLAAWEKVPTEFSTWIHTSRKVKDVSYWFPAAWL